ncbi:hypothetical protein EVAR_53193_1 [Eumeta japonica]|uniref:Uncharacterized protein n=1 Tax=Eumeta variegata TaxID=151549 RepID=A0A4C1YYN3_EUMVA|nr:hypothetical protein EVAR_53193_1 [Eumeta japonica]
MGRLACRLRDTDTTPILQFPALITAADVFVDECLVLLDVDVTVRMIMAALTGPMRGVILWITLHPEYRLSSPMFPTWGFWTGATAILRLSSTSSSEVASTRCRLDWTNRRDARSVFVPVDKPSAV